MNRKRIACAMMGALMCLGLAAAAYIALRGGLFGGERVQKIYSELGTGTLPHIRVQQGVPVEWTIHADEKKLNDCNKEIVIFHYDLDIPLKAGDNLIRFRPEEAGTISYYCWRGTLHGTITVEASEDSSQGG